MMKYSFSRVSTMSALFVLLGWGLLSAQPVEPLRVVTTKTHRFQEFAPGVFFAQGAGPVPTYSNSMVIITSQDAIIVDSHVTALAARALVSSVQELTEKPVRFLINTHHHFDHVHGNEGFPEGVSIIGHEYARERLLPRPLRDKIYLDAVGRSRKAVENLEAKSREETDPEAVKQLHERLSQAQAHLKSLVETQPVPPDITLNRRLTIYRDGRPIQVIFLGKAHTAGDVVVFLPQEKLLFTGDLIMPMPSYMGDAFIDEWNDVLDKLQKLDFDVVLPGHGSPFRDRVYFTAFQKVLTSLWDQLSEMHRQGIPPDDAILKVDLSEPLSFYDPAIVPNHMRDLDPRIAHRVYKRLDELGKD